MSIVLVGSTSGSITLQEPAVAGTTVLTLPAVTGTVLTTTSPKAGNVIQVVSAATATQTSTTSTSFVDCTNVTASITPTNANNKILVLITASGLYKQSTSGQAISLRVLRGASEIAAQINIMYSTTTFDFVSESGFVVLDSPATTSSTTYKLQIRARVSGTVQINQDNASDVSTITLMEIAA